MRSRNIFKNQTRPKLKKKKSWIIVSLWKSEISNKGNNRYDKFYVVIMNLKLLRNLGIATAVVIAVIFGIGFLEEMSGVRP